jgi:hypothetical protein
VILIALGLLFLLGRMDWFSWHLFGYTWPLLLIGLGVWLIVRRMQETQGGHQSNPPEKTEQGNTQGGSQ